MYVFVKRVIDISLSMLALVLLLPLFFVVCIVLSVTGERDVFFFQKRVGYKDTIFDIWKFATMQRNSANIGTGTLTLRNDPRVTPFGRILRMTKINELPQIINVLIGNMSIVGPRPLMIKDAERYPEDIKNQVYNVKPGITGIGSIIFRDEEALVSNAEIDPIEYYKNFIMPYKGALELWYQKNLSLKTDLAIIFLTAWAILVPKSNLAFRIFSDLPKRDTFLQTN